MSDIKTPDAGEKGGAASTNSIFTEREEKFLKIAMAQCLKGGVPEIDMQKFMKHGEFNTMKTAQNTWGKIKSKLVQVAGVPEPDKPKSEDGAEVPPKSPATPGSKKRGKKAAAAEEGEDGDGSPKKKRKSPAKKTPKKSPGFEVYEDDDTEKVVKSEMA